MERRRALALASTATLLVGSTIVSVASVSGASFLGFGGGSSHSATAGTGGSAPAPGVVHQTRNIYDRYVLDVGGGSTDAGPTGSPHAPSALVAVPNFGVGDASGPSGPDQSTTTTRPAPSPHTPPSTPRSSKPKVAAPTPTTEPDEPTPVTTTPAPTSAPTTTATTTTTWPQGVPHDWPKNKPIPPMPPNCRQPQLEDNGVWNCDH